MSAMDKKQAKWFVLALLAVVFIAIIAARFSNTPTATRADIVKADAYCIRGADYAKKGEYDKAVSDFNKALEINPKDAEAYYNRGSIYYWKNQYILAISDYTKAIEINPRHFKPYRNRGGAYTEIGEHDLAISDFTKVIEINPRYAEAYCIRAFNYTKKDEFEKAWEDVHKAQSLGYQVDPKFLKLLRQALGRKR